MTDENDDFDDFEQAATVALLQRKLGDKCTSKIIERVLDAEKIAVTRRESLADMLDAAILGAAEYADKVNLVASAFLAEVSEIIGPELCRKVYDLGPEEKPVLVDPRLMDRTPQFVSSQILAEIAVSELILEQEHVRREGGETEFVDDFHNTIVYISAKADVHQIMSESIKEVLLYWQAAYLSSFIASRHSGGGVSRVAWRISDRILATADWCLVPTRSGVVEYFALLPKGKTAGNTVMTELRALLDGGDEFAIRRHEIIAWLRLHAQRVGRTSIRTTALGHSD